MTRTRGDQIAIVQAAVDVQAAAKEAAQLLTEIRKGEALLEHGERILMDRRFRLGQVLADVRKTFPPTGRRAAGWGEFCEELGISRDTAARYIETAEQVAVRPELAERRTWMDLYRELGLAQDGAPRFAAAAAANSAAAQQNDAPASAEPPDRPFAEVLFAGTPDTGEPPRTAGPGAETVVLDLPAEADTSSFSASNQVEKEEVSAPEIAAAAVGDQAAEAPAGDHPPAHRAAPAAAPPCAGCAALRDEVHTLRNELTKARLQLEAAEARLQHASNDGDALGPAEPPTETYGAGAHDCSRAPMQAATDEPAGGAAQAELSYEREPDAGPTGEESQERPAKKRKAAAPTPWTAGDQVLYERKGKARRAIVAFVRPDGQFCLVLRGEGRRHGSPGTAPVLAMELRPDPQPGPLAEAVAEALAVLRACATPPPGWIAQLEERARES